MGFNRKVKGNFLIESVEGTDEVILKSQTVRIQGLDRYTQEPDVDGIPNFTNEIIIDGHLTVKGNTTTVSTTNTSVVDTFMVLNSGEQGNGISLSSAEFLDGSIPAAGFRVDRGTLDDVGIRYNETSNVWEATDDGTIWYSLNPSLSGSFQLVNDLTPQLGGNLDVNGFDITSVANGDIILTADQSSAPASYGEVQIEPVITLTELDSIPLDNPTSVTNKNKIYAKTPGGGGTGLYVTNDVATDEELISKTKAIVYSLIF